MSELSDEISSSLVRPCRHAAVELSWLGPGSGHGSHVTRVTLAHSAQTFHQMASEPQSVENIESVAVVAPKKHYSTFSVCAI